MGPARIAIDQWQRLWDMMADMFPNYTEYAEKAGDREIPVVVLEPK